jgi:hypothetical protein
MLGSPDTEVRGAALEALAAQGAETARPAIENAARDPDRTVRLKVVQLAGQIVQSPGASSSAAGTLALALLKRLARDVDAAVRARASAVLALLRPVTTPPSDGPATTTAPPAKTTAAPVSPTPASVDAGTSHPPDAATETAVNLPQTPTPPEVDTQETGASGNPTPHPTAAPAKLGRDEIAAMMRAGSDAFKHQDYRKAQKSLERLSGLCEREAKACMGIGYDLAYYLGRTYEAQGQLAESMNEFQRLEGQRGGGGEQRTYLATAVQRLSKKLGRVQVQRLKKGRCQTTIMWVTPGEQVIRLSATEKRSVQVAANQKTSVGDCK